MNKVSVQWVLYCVDATLLHSGQRQVESVEDVVSWDQVVARYIQLQGGAPDTCDHQ